MLLDEVYSAVRLTDAAEPAHMPHLASTAFHLAYSPRLQRLTVLTAMRCLLRSSSWRYIGVI
jgi:hypothetical protein